MTLCTTVLLDGCLNTPVLIDIILSLDDANNLLFNVSEKHFGLKDIDKPNVLHHLMQTEHLHFDP